ncbi:MAG: hypothetical protein ACM3JL_00115 [Nitrososphaerota archaeon]
MASILSISTDLMLGSKVEAQLTAAGHEVTTAPSIESASREDKDLIVADLDAEDPAALVAPGLPVLGYYSHIDVATKEAAEAAGIALVVPRSRMARELPDLASSLIRS